MSLAKLELRRFLTRAWLMSALAVGLSLNFGNVVDSQEQPPPTETTTEEERPKPKPEAEAAEEKDEKTEERRRRIKNRARNSMGAISNLIAIPQIQEELKLTEDQRHEIRDRLRKMQLQLQKQFSDVKRLPREERSAKIRELKRQSVQIIEERQDQILNLLTVEQRRRLTGISLQYRGAEALLDDRVADLLGLSEAQRSEVLRIAEELDRDLAAARKKLSQTERKDRKAERRKFFQQQRQMRQQAENAMLAVLTDKQLRQFEELQGEKFRVRKPKPPTPIHSSETKRKPVPLKELE